MVEDGAVISVTTETVPGRSVHSVIGMVWGTSYPNRNLNSPKSATREEAYSNLGEKARSLGANAVIAVRSDSFLGVDGGYPSYEQFTFYGTAVILE